MKRLSEAWRSKRYEFTEKAALHEGTIYEPTDRPTDRPTVSY